MKAAVIKKYKQKNIEIIDVEKPKVKDDEVLVEIYAASVNPVDFKIRDGHLCLLY